MDGWYAIYDDETSTNPTAVFAYLEDAMNWAVLRSPGGGLRIGYVALARVDSDDAPAGRRGRAVD